MQLSPRTKITQVVLTYKCIIIPVAVFPLALSVEDDLFILLLSVLLLCSWFILLLLAVAEEVDLPLSFENKMDESNIEVVCCGWSDLGNANAAEDEVHAEAVLDAPNKLFDWLLLLLVFATSAFVFRLFELLLILLEMLLLLLLFVFKLFDWWLLRGDDMNGVDGFDTQPPVSSLKKKFLYNTRSFSSDL